MLESGSCVRRPFFALLLVLSFSFSAFCEDGTVEFSGEVLDSQNDAFSGAHVFLYEISYDPVDFHVNRRLIERTKADSSGQFVFKIAKSAGDIPRHAVVLSVAAFHSMRWVPCNCLADKSAVLRLGEYDKFAGVVKDLEGRPVSDATVRAILKLPPSDGYREFYCFDWLTAQTDKMGRFSFDFIPKDAVAEFNVEVEGKLSSHGSVGHYRDFAFQYKAGDRNISITVFDESSISGVVVDHEGNPLGDIGLVLSSVRTVGVGGAVSKSDSEGRFIFEHLGSGFYSIHLSNSEENAEWGAESVGVLVNKGEDKTNVTYRLSRTDTVQFDVVDSESGEAVEDAWVYLYRKGRGVYDSYGSSGYQNPYSSDGRTFHVLSGKYGYSVTADGYNELPYEKEVVVREGESSAITVKLDRAVADGEEAGESSDISIVETVLSGTLEIGGKVVDVLSRPVDGVVVTLYDLLRPRDGDSYYQFRIVGTATSDESGKYVFERKAAASDVVHSILVAYKEGYAIGVGLLELYDKIAQTIKIETGSKGYYGRVVDSSGNPIGGARVCAYVSSYDVRGYFFDTKMETKMAHTEWASSRTDEDGVFSILYVPKFAKAEFTVEAEGYSQLFS